MAEPQIDLGLSRLQADLVGRVVDDLVRQDYPLGHHLTEIGVSERFGVSRSPVRGALRYLEGRGIFRFEENKGFFLAVPARDIDRQSSGLPPSGQQALYLAITRDRTAKALPTSFSESDLMRRYDCSRALLSRVLTRMSEEGLVSRSKGHGWSFVPLLDSEEATTESYRLRLLLEPAGPLEPTFRADPGLLRRSRAAHQAVVDSGAEDITSTGMFDINAEFHEMLAAFSGNRFILQNMVRHNRLRRLNEYSAFRDRARMVLSCREHLGIINALLDDDRFWASTLLREHLTGALNHVSAVPEPRPDRRSPGRG